MSVIEARTGRMTSVSGLRGALNTTGSLFLNSAARSPSDMYSNTMYGTDADSPSPSVHTYQPMIFAVLVTVRFN